MRLYECVFITRQDISQPQVETLTDKLADIITEHQGKILKREYWGLKNLAYRIRKNRKGHYVLLNIEANHDAMSELDRRMGLNDDIIRSLLVRIDSVDPEPSVIMQNRSDRALSDDDHDTRPTNRHTTRPPQRPSRPDRALSDDKPDTTRQTQRESHD